MIAGVKDSIPCRFAYSPGSFKTALWLKEQLEARGVEAELEPFIAYEFKKVSLSNSGIGWATGDNQVSPDGYGLFKTSDGGASWQLSKAICPKSQVTDLIAFSDDTAWLLWPKRLMRTVDGEHWETVIAIDTPRVTYLGFNLSSLHSRRGWVTVWGGKSQYLVSTADGWNTVKWDTLWSGDSGRAALFVDFVSSDTGFIGCSHVIRGTTDGGKTWQDRTDPLLSIRKMVFKDPLNGYLIGISEDYKSAFFVTTDGAVSWHTVFDTVLSTNLEDICLVGKDTVWVVGDNGFVLFSDNAGYTWSTRDIGSHSPLYAIAVNSKGQGVAAGKGDIHYSDDCNSWNASNITDTTNRYIEWNVVGTHTGDDSTKVIIGAHYDAVTMDSVTRTFYTPGADDNASGISAVLEAARLLSSKSWKHSLRFICFGGEELGLLGSLGYVNRLMDSNEKILSVLNADMIGYDGNKDFQMEINSNPQVPKSVAAGKIALDVIKIYDISLDPLHMTTGLVSNSDHYFFSVNMIPAISIEENHMDFNPFYHSTQDKLSALNTNYMTSNVKACVGWMAVMANMDSLVSTEEKPTEPLPEIATLKLSSNIIRSSAYLEVSSSSPVTPCIYDASGRKVKTLAVVQPLSRMSFDVSDLPAGVYWVGIKGTRGTVSERFVLIR